MAIADIERLAHRPVGAAVRRYQKGAESDRGDFNAVVEIHLQKQLQDSFLFVYLRILTYNSSFFSFSTDGGDCSKRMPPRTFRPHKAQSSPWVLRRA